jgi:hypothetical protein
MSDDEKKAFFNKIDKAWKGKGEKNEGNASSEKAKITINPTEDDLRENLVVSEKKVPKKGSPDYHQHKIAVDTVKNPRKSFMGGPSPKEAEQTLLKKFGYSKKEVEKLKESINERKPSKIVFDNRKLSDAKRINVRNWYMKTFPTDELGVDIDKRISLLDVYEKLSKGVDAYKIIGVNDSVVRERIFEKLSKVLGLDYDVIYNMWESLVNEESLNEMSDLEFVGDQLANAVADGMMNRREFISFMSAETKFDKNALGKIYDAYLDLDARERMKLDMTRNMMKFLKGHGLKESVVNESNGEFVVFIEKDNGRKKLLHTKKSQRAANMFMTKNVDKILNKSGIRSIGSMSKDEWEKTEARFAENIKKSGMRTVTRKEWDRTHKDFKGMIKGQPHMMYLDKKTNVTKYGPVHIKESVDEGFKKGDTVKWAGDKTVKYKIEKDAGKSNKTGVKQWKIVQIDNPKRGAIAGEPDLKKESVVNERRTASKPIKVDDDTMVQIVGDSDNKRFRELTAALNPKTGKPIQKFGFDRGNEIADTKDELIKKLQKKYGKSIKFESVNEQSSNRDIMAISRMTGVPDYKIEDFVRKHKLKDLKKVKKLVKGMGSKKAEKFAQIVGGKFSNVADFKDKYKNS